MGSLYFRLISLFSLIFVHGDFVPRVEIERERERERERRSLLRATSDILYMCVFMHIVPQWLVLQKMEKSAAVLLQRA